MVNLEVPLYNLLVSGGPWFNESGSMLLGRVGEYTEEKILSKYCKQDQGFLFEQLIKFPCLFMEEGADYEVAFIGQITDWRVQGNSVHFEWQKESGMPIVRNRHIEFNRAKFAIMDSFEFGRTHWAIKDRDLYRAMCFVTAEYARRAQPAVFKLPDPAQIDDWQVSVMMPFALDFAPVYEALKRVAASHNAKCNRGDDIWTHEAVIQDVVNLIDKSKIVIADCTGRNANVFYEAGLAHALGRNVILITQSKDDVPFDLSHIRYVKYVNNGEGLAKLETDLRVRLGELLNL